MLKMLKILLQILDGLIGVGIMFSVLSLWFTFVLTFSTLPVVISTFGIFGSFFVGLKIIYIDWSPNFISLFLEKNKNG